MDILMFGISSICKYYYFQSFEFYVLWSSAGNIYTNISEPIVYQPKLEGETKKHRKISIASSSSYSS